MTTQSFGRILHSEQLALRTLSHVTRSVFQELKCKYYPPNKNNPKGSRPDFLNAEELKAADISKASYQRAIRDLLTVGLIRIAGYKAINGRQCRLFDYPHEVGVFKEIPQTHETVEQGVIVSQSIRRAQRDTSKDHGGPFKDTRGIRVSPEGILVNPDRPNRELPFRKEDKKIKKEDTEEVGDSAGLVVSEEDLLCEDLPLNDLEATLKESDSKIFARDLDPVEVSMNNEDAFMKSLTPVETQLYKDALALMEELTQLERIQVPSREKLGAVEGAITQFHEKLTQMKAFPALAEHRKVGVECVSEWVTENRHICNVAVTKLVDQMFLEGTLRRSILAPNSALN